MAPDEQRGRNEGRGRQDAENGAVSEMGGKEGSCTARESKKEMRSVLTKIFGERSVDWETERLERWRVGLKDWEWRVGRLKADDRAITRGWMAGTFPFSADPRSTVTLYNVYI